ncbi:MAG: hypothetical protein CBC83_02525 [Flavobacteriales bacterium TMED123]|nr:MAG: hypothetical protein CBC83_02525 [Flavobacteriales bacterium TMED123]
MKHLVTILGHARTGSNYLCKLIEESFPDVVSHYELFNKQMCHINLDYKDRLEKHYKTDNLHKVANNNPLDFMETVINLSDKNIVSHKIFPEHITLENAKKIVNRSRMIFVVKRNFIDVYISKKRAIMMTDTHNNPWIDVDTTNFKIDFNRDEFIKQKKIYEEWYRNMTDYLITTGKPYTTLYYDEFHSLNIKGQQELIKEKMERFINGECLNLNVNSVREVLKKQDKSLDYKTKVNNHKEFMDFVCNS